MKQLHQHPLKQELTNKLIAAKAFWSYAMPADVVIPDEVLIEKTMIHLDIEEINQLFLLYPKSKIKAAWRDRLVVQGDGYYTLNNFIARVYFKVKNPDAYFKRVTTNYLTKIQCQH
jgi:hypothetical protein